MKTCLKPVWLIHFPFFPLFLRWVEKRGKLKRITSCRTVSDPIDFHPIYNTLIQAPRNHFDGIETYFY